jgi:hypothetical protein
MSRNVSFVYGQTDRSTSPYLYRISKTDFFIKSCQKVVKRLSKSCQKVFKKVFKKLSKVAKKLPKNCQKLPKKVVKKVKTMAKLKKCKKTEILKRVGGEGGGGGGEGGGEGDL